MSDRISTIQWVERTEDDKTAAAFVELYDKKPDENILTLIEQARTKVHHQEMIDAANLACSEIGPGILPF